MTPSLLLVFLLLVLLFLALVFVPTFLLLAALHRGTTAEQTDGGQQVLNSPDQLLPNVVLHKARRWPQQPLNLL